MISEYQHEIINDRPKLVKLYQDGILDSDGDYFEKYNKALALNLNNIMPNTV